MISILIHKKPIVWIIYFHSPSNETTAKKCFKTFRNGWILVKMLSFLLVVFRFFLMEFQLVFIHENQQLETKINEMFENGCK